MEFSHRPVLLEPTVSALLDPDFGAKPGKRSASQSVVHANAGRRQQGVFVDGTFGRGGHSRLLLSRLAPQAKLLVLDKDPEAIAAARALAAEDCRVLVAHAGFATLAEQLDALGILHVDGVMLDLGVSSPQIDDAARGFSFMRDGPLDMRMDTSRGLTAAQWLAEASQEDITEVIAHYGEERFAFQIAAAIVNRRESRPLRTTHDLAELVSGVVRTREKGQHPATRTFQALRIHLNQELEELAHALASILTRLAPGGRLAVISFHSLEDRMVKQCIARAARPGQAQARMPILEKDMPQPVLHSLGRVLATEDEVAANPRSRSATLRVAERTSTPLAEGQAVEFVQPSLAGGGRRRNKGTRAGAAKGRRH